MSCCNNKKKEQTSCCAEKSTEKRTATTIHPSMTIEEILSMFPHKAQKLSQEITNAGLHCVGCQAATWETLEAGMMSHGMGRDAIEKLVSRLNALLQEQADESTITVTPRAAAKYQEILAEEGKAGWGMRFAEKMAGCNGFEYFLDYSEKAEADDQIFHCSGVEVHVNKGMVPRLLGSVIDFVDGLRGSGFKITNPNVKSSCGCGTSHNY